MKNYIIVSIERLIIVFFKLMSLFLLMKYLSVAEMGTIALLSMLVGLGSLLIDSGFSGAFLRKDNILKDDYDFLFTNSLIVSFFVYLISLIVAYFIQVFNHVHNFLIYTSIIMMFSFLKAKIVVGNLFLLNKRDFKKQANINNLSQVISFFGLFFGLYVGLKIYAFIIQIIIESFILFVFYSKIFVFKNFINLNYSRQIELIKVAYSTLASSLIKVLYENFVILIILNNYGINKVGVYSQANKINSLFITSFMGVVDKVSYVTYTKCDNFNLVKKFNVISFVVILFSVIILLILLLSSKYVILNFLNEEWKEVILLVPYVLITSLLIVGDLNARTIIKAKMSASTIFFNEVVKKSLGVVIIIFAIFYGFDLVNLMKAIVFISLFSLLVSFFTIIKVLKYNILTFLNYIFLIFSTYLIFLLD